MSRGRSRVRNRQEWMSRLLEQGKLEQALDERLEELRRNYKEARRYGTTGVEKFFDRVARSDVRLWEVMEEQIQPESTQKNDIEEAESTHAMIVKAVAKAVAPELAGKTPWGVIRRRALGEEEGKVQPLN